MVQNEEWVGEMAKEMEFKGWAWLELDIDTETNTDALLDYSVVKAPLGFHIQGPSSCPQWACNSQLWHESGQASLHRIPILQI